MKAWHILVLLALAVVLFVAYMHHKKTLVPAPNAPKANNSVGGQLAKNVPIYGAAVKAASVVEKPAAAIFNGVNNAVTSGLSHIPVVGGIISEPTKIAGKVVNGALNFLGF
jgi:hypothetical protein